MNTKRLIFAVIAVLIVLEATNYLINGLILASTYSQESIAKIFRPMEEMNKLMWRIWIADVVWSFFFVFIFVKGYQNKGIMEGVRYGIYIGLFMNFMAVVAQNVIYPLPYTLALQWFIYGLIQCIIFGVIAALVYKPAEVKTQE